MDYYNELYHYGVKGMKWGVRRYQNKDGSLTKDGLRRYRKEYDDIKQLQTLSDRAKTVNKTGISAIDNYNSRYYDKESQAKLRLLMKKIGDRGVSQIDKNVIDEGKKVAEEAKRKAEALNKSLDLSIKGNELLLLDPQREYDYHYNRYVGNNLVKR